MGPKFFVLSSGFLNLVVLKKGSMVIMLYIYLENCDLDGMHMIYKNNYLVVEDFEK